MEKNTAKVLILLAFIVGAAFVVLSYFYLTKPITTKTKAASPSFNLIAPAGTLTRGGPAQFTVEINTNGTPLSTVTTGLKYKADELQFNSVVKGNTFSNVSATFPDSSTILIDASNATPFNGSGIFAVLNFTVVATGSTGAQLCSLFTPSPSPTPTVPVPTDTPFPTWTPVPTITQSPTWTPMPTPTNTPIPTPTFTPTPTPTDTPTPSPTPYPTAIPTATPYPTTPPTLAPSVFYPSQTPRPPVTGGNTGLQVITGAALLLMIGIAGLVL